MYSLEYSTTEHAAFPGWLSARCSTDPSVKKIDSKDKASHNISLSDEAAKYGSMITLLAAWSHLVMVFALIGTSSLILRLIGPFHMYPQLTDRACMEKF